MINVKLSHPAWPIIRQPPDTKAYGENVAFFCNTDVDCCDYWFVLEGSDKKKETAGCPKANTVFIAGESPTLKTYKKEFLQQFAAVITSDANIDHPDPILRQQGLPWHVGRRQRNHVNIEFTKDYDELKAMADIPKTKLSSTAKKVLQCLYKCMQLSYSHYFK